jgi:hypothetical protein
MLLVTQQPRYQPVPQTTFLSSVLLSKPDAEMTALTVY